MVDEGRHTRSVHQHPSAAAEIIRVRPSTHKQPSLQAAQAAQKQAASVQAEKAATELRQERQDEMARAVRQRLEQQAREEEAAEERRRAGDGGEEDEEGGGKGARSAKMVVLNRFNRTRSTS